MPPPLILASASQTRQSILANAGLKFETVEPRIDEEAIRAALICENAAPRDIADSLAEMKARKIAEKFSGAMVIGCDQVLDFGGTVVGKPVSSEDLSRQLRSMRGKTHTLLSAVVIYEDIKPVWRHVGISEMIMYMISEDYIQSYVSRNWNSVRHAAGGYHLECEGVRLFSQISGDYFTVLGLPLLELLSYLRQRGVIEK